MKKALHKIIFGIVCLLATPLAYGQQAGLVVTPDMTVLQTNDVLNAAEIHATVQNQSSQPMRIVIEKANASVTSGHATYFCWSINCYSPNTVISTDTVTINPGETNHTFKSYVDAYAVSGFTNVRYTFRDVAGSGQSQTINLEYYMGVTSNRHPFAAAFTAYPMPARGQFTLQVPASVAGKGLMVEAVSATGARFALTSREMGGSSLHVSTQGLKGGVYTLLFGGKAVGTISVI